MTRSERSERMKAVWATPARRAAPATPSARAVRNAAIAAGGRVDCAKCGAVLPLSDFPETRKTRKGQPRYAYCKKCHVAQQRELRLRNFYGLTPEDYDVLFRFQGGVCFICGTPPKTNRLAVDHDHRTGLIRGLLCPFCNRVIGRFRDDAGRFQRAADYLRSPPATEALGCERYGLKGRISNKAATRRRLNGGSSVAPTPVVRRLMAA